MYSADFEKQPKGEFNVYSSFLKNLVLPLYDLATDTPTRKCLKDLEKSQWFSPDKIRQLQEKKLKCLIKHAYDTVPYYRNVFRANKLNPSEIRSVKDLAKLPILTRSETLDRFNSLISNEYPKRKMLHGATGGSTGRPIRFITTKENRAWSMAARYLAWRWAGYEIGDRYAYVWGIPLDKPALESLKEKFQGKIKNRIYLAAFKASEKTMKKFVDKMKDFNPKVIYGYSQSVYLLAKFIEERAIQGVHVQSVIIDSMSLFPYEVETIERVFGCRVWWNYHDRENGTFGSECSEHAGYHLFAQNSIFEFIEKGEEVAPGEVGSIVVTDLTNYAMPFIRYEVGDAGVQPNEPCACGRGLPVMKELLGRTSEILVSKTGEFLILPFYEYRHLFDVTKIRQYQIVQENPTKLTVKIIPSKGYAAQDAEVMRKVILSLMGDMEIEIEIVDKIPSSDSGKRKVTLRKFPIQFT